jgi:multidrug efflux pump subunit AcrA (membrane-fusion protein)
MAMASVLVLGAGVFSLMAISPSKAVEAKTVQAVSVTEGSVVHTLAMAGSVVSNQSVTLDYSGNPTTVSKVAVSIGQSVAAGQTLATMANGSTLTAPFAGRVVALNLQAGDLVPSTASSSAATAPSASTTTSGFSGRFGHGGIGVASTPAVSQAVVTAGSPLSITVANVKKVSVLAQVPETDIHAVRLGEKVTMGVEGEPGYVYHGVVSAISDVPTTSSSGSGVTYPVSVTLPIASGQPRPWLGMSVELEAQTASASGLVVPVAAVHTLGSGWGVRLASGKMVPVKLGLTSTNSVIVTQGLTAGQSVLSPGSSTVQGSVTVEVLPSFSGFGGFGGRSGEEGGFGGGGGFSGGFGGFGGF